MAQLKNNQFSSDSDDVRQARLDLLQANIDTHAGDIAVAGVLLVWAQNAYTEYVDARSTADKEMGDIDEAYQEFQIKFNAARESYVDSKDLLKAVMKVYQDEDEAMEKYGIMGRTPRTEESLFSAIKQWRKTHDEFDAAGDPRIIAESIVAEMEADADEFDNLWRTAVTEKKEARLAFDHKQELFSQDTDYLRLVYMLAKKAWDADDPRLLELGFVPASEVWTPGQPDPEAPTKFYASVTEIGAGVWDFWCSKPEEVADANIKMKTLPDGPTELVASHMTIEEGVFLPMRISGIMPGTYEAYFTAFDPENNPWGDPVSVVFTVEPY